MNINDIGPADEVAEGVAMGTAVLTSTTTQVTVKKAGKAVELTDESVLSGYGRPMDEAARQLSMSIADRIDNDCYEALCSTKAVHNGKAGVINYDGVVDALGLIGDESDNTLATVMYVHPDQVTTLRKDPNFMSKDKYDMDVTMNGLIGKIGGASVVKSKKVKKVTYELDNEDGTITCVADETQEDPTHKHVATIEANFVGPVKVGNKFNDITSTAFFACPIVVLDREDPNEAPEADGFDTDAPALTIYKKRDIDIESDRDILKKTTVVSADEHYVAALTNESKVARADFKEK